MQLLPDCAQTAGGSGEVQTLNSRVISTSGPTSCLIAGARTVASSSSDGIGTVAHPFIPKAPRLATKLLIQHTEWYNLRMARSSGSIRTKAVESGNAHPNRSNRRPNS